ncbi:MAG TPA: hypothetical protein VF629_15080 [Hymenobacter sp.]|jgi:hypothetical protein|uniref:hypothetical protein n=1 Tax=Hymenobacter sp. TaxID=1898978 RepID=UPI002EDA1013
MRACLLFFLLYSFAAQAQLVLEANIDTATLRFMSWQLHEIATEEEALRAQWSSHFGPLQPLMLYRKPVYWPEADVGGVDTSGVFRYKLFMLHRPDTTVFTEPELQAFKQYWRLQPFANPLSPQDLQGMALAYALLYRGHWPDSLTTLKVIRRKSARRRYCEFTRPLFSADHRWVVIWQHLHSGIDGDGWAVLLYERTAATTWRLYKKVLGASVSYDYVR